MNARSLAALVLVNVVLLASLVVTCFTPRAQAQLGRGGHQYLMIAGDTAERNQQQVVYIVDLDTANMAAILFRSTDDRLEVIAGRRIGRDLQRGRQTR